jgi:hypothetical protein
MNELKRMNKNVIESKNVILSGAPGTISPVV